MVDYVPVYYGEYVYPVWCEVIGWMMAVVSLLMIPLFMVIMYVTKSEGDTPLEVSIKEGKVPFYKDNTKMSYLKVGNY